MFAATYQACHTSGIDPDGQRCLSKIGPTGGRASSVDNDDRLVLPTVGEHAARRRQISLASDSMPTISTGEPDSNS